MASATRALAIWAPHAKATPLGSHEGEWCDRDRKTIFEDPTGVRPLYDAASHQNEASTSGGKRRPVHAAVSGGAKGRVKRSLREAP